jgi:hypothetical protein
MKRRGARNRAFLVSIQDNKFNAGIVTELRIFVCFPKLNENLVLGVAGRFSQPNPQRFGPRRFSLPPKCRILQIGFIRRGAGRALEPAESLLVAMPYARE